MHSAASEAAPDTMNRSEPTISTRTITSSASGFSRVEICDGFTAEIAPAKTYSVVLTVSKNARPTVELSPESQQLSIGLRNPDGAGARVLRVRIGMPQLHELLVRSGSHVWLDRFDAGSAALDVVASGSSQVDATISCAGVSVVLTGGSRVRLAGTAAAASVVAAEHSQAELRGLDAGRLSITLGSGSRAHIAFAGSTSATLGHRSTLICPPDTAFDLLLRRSSARIEYAAAGGDAPQA